MDMELVSSPAPDVLVDIPALLTKLQNGPHGPTLTFYRGRQIAAQLDAHTLVARVEALAGYFAGELGIRHGDRVALLTLNRIEVPLVLLALMQLGAAAVPLNPASAPDDWSYILSHAGARGIIGTPDLLARVAENASLEFRRSIVELGDGVTSAATESLAEALAVILYTSGTTGAPKGVGLCQRNLLANAWSMARNFGLHGTTQLAVLPLFHAHAFGFGLMTALSTGGQLVFCEKLDPFSWAEQIRAQSVTVTSVVPTLLPVLLATNLRAADVPTLRHILVSSAPLTPDMAHAWQTQVGIPLIQGWGLSEYTNFACCIDPAETTEAREQLMFGQEVPSIGGVLPGTEVQVVGLDGAVLGEGERGELCVRGPSRMLGYYNDAEQTAKTIDPADKGGWLHTGDEGYFRLRGDRPMFYISGRIKEIIIRDGEKYSPLAIERRLVALLPGLTGKIAVVGFPHSARGEEVGLYFEGDLDDEMQSALRTTIESVPVAERPKVVLFGAEPIPRTHTGKVQRRKMLPWFAAYADIRGALKIVAMADG